MDPIALATLAIAVVFPVVTAAWSLGKSATTRRDLEILKGDFQHETKNIRTNMAIESEKLWTSQSRIEREYARRDDVRDYGQQVGAKIDRVEGKVDDLKTQLIEVLKSARGMA